MFNSIDLNKTFLIVSLLKLILSILTVFCVKFNYINFNLPIIVLTCGQFLFIFIGIVVLLKLGKITHKKIALKEIFLSTILFGFSVLFGNFSIDFNSIQVAQQFKFLQLPFMLIILTILNKQSFSYKIKILSVCLSFIYN